MSAELNLSPMELAGVSARLSPTGKDDDKTGLDRQLDSARRWCDRQQLAIHDEYIDSARSGFKAHVKRERFDEAITALRAGIFKTLVFTKVDRMTRRGMGIVGTILDQAEELGARIVFVEDGLDSSQPGQRSQIAWLAERAREESRVMSDRIKDAKAWLRPIGRWQGGQPPYGLRIVKTPRPGKPSFNILLEHDPAAYPTARKIIELAIAGQAITTIARTLNEQHTPGPRGGTWHTSTVARILTSPASVGLLPEADKIDGRWKRATRPYRDPETGDTVCVGQGLMSLSEQEKILRMIERRSHIVDDGKRKGNRAPSRHLMTGLLRCASCGKPMNSNGRSYICGSRNHGTPCDGRTTAVVPAVDRSVRDLFFARLAAAEPGDPLTYAVAERMADRRDPNAVKERAAAQHALEDAMAALRDLDDARYLPERREFDGPGGRERYERLHDILTERADHYRAILAANPAPQVDVRPFFDVDKTRALWDASDVATRRELLRLAIDVVTCTPAYGVKMKGFEADSRLSIHWAGREPHWAA